MLNMHHKREQLPLHKRIFLSAAHQDTTAKKHKLVLLLFKIFNLGQTVKFAFCNALSKNLQSLLDDQQRTPHEHIILFLRRLRKVGNGQLISGTFSDLKTKKQVSCDSINFLRDFSRTLHNYRIKSHTVSMT